MTAISVLPDHVEVTALDERGADAAVWATGRMGGIDVWVCGLVSGDSLWATAELCPVHDADTDREVWPCEETREFSAAVKQLAEEEWCQQMQEADMAAAERLEEYRAEMAYGGAW